MKFSGKFFQRLFLGKIFTEFAKKSSLMMNMGPLRLLQLEKMSGNKLLGRKTFSRVIMIMSSKFYVDHENMIP